jgi:hypothetical protein
MKHFASLKFSPNQNGIMSRTSFSPNCPSSSVWIKFLFCSDFQSVSSFQLKLTLPRCFLIAITLIWLNQVNRVRMRQKSENIVHNAIIGSFLRLCWIWDQRFRFLRLLHFAQHRNSSSPVDFKIVWILNRWSYQGVQITIGKMIKYFITLVIRLCPDSSHIGTRIEFSDYYSQSSQVRRWCQYFRLQSCWWIEHAHLPWCPLTCLDFSLYLWFLHLHGAIYLSHKLEISIFLH